MDSLLRWWDIALFYIQEGWLFVRFLYFVWRHEPERIVGLFREMRYPDHLGLYTLVSRNMGRIDAETARRVRDAIVEGLRRAQGKHAGYIEHAMMGAVSLHGGRVHETPEEHREILIAFVNWLETTHYLHAFQTRRGLDLGEVTFPIGPDEFWKVDRFFDEYNKLLDPSHEVHAKRRDLHDPRP